MSRKTLVVAALAVALSSHFSASASGVAEAPLTDEALLVEIVSAGQDLSDCVNALDAQAVRAKVLDGTDVEALERDALTVLGPSHPVFVAGEAVGRRDRVQSLLVALGEFALDERAEGPYAQSLRAKAAAIGILAFAASSDGRCIPDPNHVRWLAEVPHAGRENSR